LRRHIVLYVVVGTLVALAIAPAAAAGKGPKPKPGGGGDSTITLNQSAPIHHGDTISFSVQTSATDRPFVALECRQGGSAVYWKSVGMFPDYYEYFGAPLFTLSSLSWTGGDADCTAELQYQHKNGRMRTAASMSLHVSG
jgi:hypothetical protein